MNDQDFISAFEAAAIPLERWTHRDHLRVAFLYLRALPFEEALARLRSGIRALNRANGVQDTPTSGYHETVTVAWARVIAAAIAHVSAPDFDSFAEQRADLLNKQLLRSYYSKKRLLSPEARSSFVEPDIEALPARGALAHVVGGVLFRDGLILLGKRSASARSHPLVWDVIGGHCEAAESSEDALVRELREELGITAVRYRSIGVFFEPEDQPIFRVHLFVIEEWEGVPSNCSSEHTAIAWHDPRVLASLPLASARYQEILANLSR